MQLDFFHFARNFIPSSNKLAYIDVLFLKNFLTIGMVTVLIEELMRFELVEIFPEESTEPHFI